MKITFDNGEVYTEEQFKKDFIRMMDSVRFEDSISMHTTTCSGVICENCYIARSCSHKITDIGSTSYKVIEDVYNWSQEHPIVTNRDKLKEVFGFDKICCNFSKNQLKIVYQGISRIFTCDDDDIWDISEWFEEEYKEPKKDEL